MARNTNPWIQFYTRDWLESERVMDMSCAAEGVYIRCLAAQHVRGNIPADLTKLARVLNKPIDEIENVWHEVSIHFETETIDGEDRLFNEKLRDQILETEAKSKNYSKAQKKRHKVKSGTNLTPTCPKSDTNLSQIPSVSVSVSSSVSESVSEGNAKGKDKGDKKPEYTEAELALGRRFAQVRADISGMKQIKQAAVDYFTGLMHEILEDGEVDADDLEQIATWFATTPKGRESFQYGVGNIARGYTSVLRKNIASYLACARGGQSLGFSSRQGYTEPVKQESKQLPAFDAVPAMLWEGVDYHFRQNDPEAAEEWIAPLKPLGVSGGELWVAAPSNFGRNWVIRNYLDSITEQAAMPVKVISLEEYQGGAC